VERQPAHPILYSVQGYQYCDLLFGQGQTSEVPPPGVQTLDGSSRNTGSSTSASTTCRSAAPTPPAPPKPFTTSPSRRFPSAARDSYLSSLALLARAHPTTSKRPSASPNPLRHRLHLADYHLAKGNLAEAEALINATGYHRRDPELAALRARVAAVRP